MFLLDLLENLKIDQTVPLKSCASLYSKDPLTVVIKPFDPANFKKVEKHLQLFIQPTTSAASSGVHSNPLNMSLQSKPDVNELLFILPKWTAQSRDHVTKLGIQATEEYRKKLRITRQAAIEELKSWIVQKDHLFKAEELVQKTFEKYSKKIGDYLDLKTKEMHQV